LLRKILVYIGGSLNIIWGISHLIPTKNIIKGFGEITPDNRYIIQMEWINEGMTLIFIGLIAVVVTVFTKKRAKAIKLLYLLSALMLTAMAVLSLNTGFRIDFLPFKLCLPLFLVSAVLIGQYAFGCDSNNKEEGR
jgi:CHASE2 domain-containing sensor protein